MEEVITTLNINSGLIQALATVILVIVTAVYAYFTHRMVSLTAQQVVSDIKIYNIILSTELADKEVLKRFKQYPGQVGGHYYRFTLFLDIYNRSSGSGSVEKPLLILKFCNDNYEYELAPVTEIVHSREIGRDGPLIRYDNYTERLGGAIFLRGGELQKVEVSYEAFRIPDELSEHIKNNLSDLKYSIKFCDNLGKKYLLSIDEIKAKGD